MPASTSARPPSCGQSELRGDLAAAQVAVDQQNAIAGLRMQYRKVRCDEGLAGTRRRTCDGEHVVARTLDVAHERCADGAQRFDGLRSAMSSRAGEWRGPHADRRCRLSQLLAASLACS